MNCLRCGYCCHKLAVIIVANPKLGIVESNLEAHNGSGPCKHLQGNKPGEYNCTIHDEPWYLETLCACYAQIGEGNCRMGEAVMNGKLRTQFPKLKWSWNNT